jgi:hypothetical protein
MARSIPRMLMEPLVNFIALSASVGTTKATAATMRERVQQYMTEAFKQADIAHDLAVEKANNDRSGVPAAIMMLYIIRRCKEDILKNELTQSIAARMDLL